jgi:hypothetical protein
MSAKPWMKFYPRDWQSDVALRACSIAARGLWIEMICYMHGAEPYGYLAFNGKAIPIPRLSSIVGVEATLLRRLLGELQEAGVFSTENGVIFSRKMVRDQVLSEAGREHVAKRWRDKEDQGLSGEPTERAKSDPNSQAIRSPNSLPRARPTQRLRDSEEELPSESLLPPDPNGSDPQTKKRKKRPLAPRRLVPEDWTPSARNIADAIKRGMPEREIARQARQFIDFHRGRGTLVADLNSTWRTWAGNFHKYGTKNGSAPPREDGFVPYRP